SSRRRHTRSKRDWSSDVCSSDLRFMKWYEKLSEYFPVEEMKSKRHMDILLKEKGEVYYKDEGPYHVLMFAEFDTFVFIDYLWVRSEERRVGRESRWGRATHCERR